MSEGLAFLLILVPLVVFHEFGHFIVCKLGGIKVTKFAFGFGKKLFGFHFKGTEYRWNLIPLGGYVDFMGEEVIYNDKIPDDVAHFYNKPKFLRFLVLVMGPAFNLILAFGILWCAFYFRPFEKPVYNGDLYTVGQVTKDSPEAQAGLKAGDRILSYNGQPVVSHTQMAGNILLSPKKTMTLAIEREGQQLELSYTVPTDPVEGVGQLNFSQNQRIIIYRVYPETPAEAAGFRKGDILLAINGAPINMQTRSDGKINELVKAAAPGPSIFTLERGGEQIELSVSPMKNAEGNWLVGFIHWTELHETQLSATAAVGQAWKTSLELSTLIYKAVHKLVTRQISHRALSGPVSVGKAAKERLEEGFWSFLFLMAVLSINLGLLNLLPIPVLDGGEIFVLLVEWVTRRDFKLMTKMRIKLVGFFFLVGLMGLVIITDFVKLYQAG